MDAGRLRRSQSPPMKRLVLPCILLVCSAAHAEERTVTGHGYAEGGRDPKQIALRQAEQEAQYLASAIPFTVDLDAEGQPLETRSGAIRAQAVRSEQTGKEAWAVEVDVVMAPATAERRAKLGEPHVRERKIIGSRAFRSHASSVALGEIVRAENPCGPDVRVLSGVIDLVDVSVAKKLDGKSWVRVAAHVTFDACGDAREL